MNNDGLSWMFMIIVCLISFGAAMFGGHLIRSHLHNGDVATVVYSQPEG